MVEVKSQPTQKKPWRKVLFTVLRLAFVALAVWFISGMVSWEDRARLAENPSEAHVIVDETSDGFVILEGEQERHVGRDALATPEQLEPHQQPVEPGLRSAGENLDWATALLSFGAFGLAVVQLIVRFHQLVRAVLRLRFVTVAVLTLTGNLLNLMLPGGNGGDIYKGFQLARMGGARGVEAVTILLVERVLGLLSFALLAATAMALSWNPAFAEVGRVVFGLVVVGFTLGFAYTSTTVRSTLKWEKWRGRLPLSTFIERIDGVLMDLRRTPRRAIIAMVLSSTGQLSVALGVALLALAIGVDPGDRGLHQLLFACILAFSVGTIISAVPVTIQGFGLMEAVFFKVLVLDGWCTVSQMLVITLGMRAIGMLWAVPGVAGVWSNVGRLEGHGAG